MEVVEEAEEEAVLEEDEEGRGQDGLHQTIEQSRSPALELAVSCGRGLRGPGG